MPMQFIMHTGIRHKESEAMHRAASVIEDVMNVPMAAGEGEK